MQQMQQPGLFDDAFGVMQQSAPSFPSYIAYEDSAITLGFEMQRDPMSPNNHTVTAHFKNKSNLAIS